MHYSATLRNGNSGRGMTMQIGMRLFSASNAVRMRSFLRIDFGKALIDLKVERNKKRERLA